MATPFDSVPVLRPQDLFIYIAAHRVSFDFLSCLFFVFFFGFFFLTKGPNVAAQTLTLISSASNLLGYHTERSSVDGL